MLRVILPLILSIALGVPLEAQVSPAYVSRVDTESTFDQISAPVPFDDRIDRTTKLLVPARDDGGLLDPVFQNVNRYLLHWEFLAAEFPDRFPGLTAADFRNLVERRATRDYFAGTLSRYTTDEGSFYGFSAAFDQTNPAEVLALEEVAAMYDSLAAVFTLAPLVYAPEDPLSRAEAESWGDAAPFPVHLGAGSGGSFQAYTSGVAYGRVRLVRVETIDQPDVCPTFGRDDILVLDRAPRDIESVIAGAITSEPQGPLSHLMVRTARRGTPNAWVDAAFRELAPLAGRLVRLEVTPTSFRFEDATEEDAEAWRRSVRPSLSRLPEIDEDHGDLDRISEIALASDDEPLESRYGGKASQLARLQPIFSGELEKYREDGFVIPMRYFLEFMRENTIDLFGGDPRSYEEFLRDVTEADDFQADIRIRCEILRFFRDVARDEGRVPPELITQIAAKIEEVFGPGAKVRFRSSSNVEDSLEFNGAGLYESTSVCLSVSEGEPDAPSACDPLRAGERTIERALKKVWTSLFTLRAYEERSWYQIPEDRVAMAILVTRAFDDERANGVAFTGNPSSSLDDRFVVAAQVGEESVVSPLPGVRPERVLLDVEDGELRSILRAESSTLLPPGTAVLDDSMLEELATVLWKMHTEFPVETGDIPRSRVLLDTEFKIEPDGSLAIKQVRPFLRPEDSGSGATLELIIPEGTIACGVFIDGRSVKTEHELKCQILFRPGSYPLAVDVEQSSVELIEEVRFGPDSPPAAPRSPAEATRTTGRLPSGETVVQFELRQVVALENGEELELLLELPARREWSGVATLTIDEEFLAARPLWTGVPDGDRGRLVRFASCSYESLPLWHIYVDLIDGMSIRLEERYRPPIGGSGPANLVGASLTFPGGDEHIADYWRLVYGAELHNLEREYWVVLDPPRRIATSIPVRVIHLTEPIFRGPVEIAPATATYLDEAFDLIATRIVRSWWRGLEGEPPPTDRFRRGDVDGSGSVALSDPIQILAYRFLGGDEPTCPDAADFDDDGAVSITDAVLILGYLFQGVDLSPTPGPRFCATDGTRDFLARCRGSGCE